MGLLEYLLVIFSFDLIVYLEIQYSKQKYIVFSYIFAEKADEKISRKSVLFCDLLCEEKKPKNYQISNNLVNTGGL